MKRRLFVALGLGIVLLAIGFLYVRETPHYSLYRLVLAIQRHDPDEAMKYVDVDSIVDNLSTHLIGSKATGRTDRDGKKPSLKTMIGKALPGMKESIKASLRNAISSHGDAGDNHHQPAPNAIAINNLDLRKVGQTSFWDLEVQRDKEIAIIRLKKLPGVRARMVKTRSGHWQVVEILQEVE
ncbi:MAG: hypothetical protein A4E62_02113 [Syntrophorhabdus sp. PtaU1.Bin002]|nr:MAG: hypothetical protein A4E62_02113 [Syntrophorhabdus sp. PtaU1.Bin002]